MKCQGKLIEGMRGVCISISNAVIRGLGVFFIVWITHGRRLRQYNGNSEFSQFDSFGLASTSTVAP
jgi:hypothetical protein